MEDFIVLVSVLMIVRIALLSTERVAFHGLGRGSYSAFATMGIAFWGASLVLWGVALEEQQAVWIGDTVWIGLIYAFAFGLYTAALTKGSVGGVSAWTNLTIVLLWIIHPTGGWISILGIFIFTTGALWLAGKRITTSVLLIVCSDIMFVAARLLDASHTHLPSFSYAASLFTSISLWMTIGIVLNSRVPETLRLFWARPGWSLASAATNAGAYLSLFLLLHWLPPALVEAVSAFAAFVATLVGVVFFQEQNAKLKLTASFTMTIGVMILLIDHYHSIQQVLF
ncbi:hypothetical protein [Alicyclobacillus sp. SO9]|uniref:hypothetical protein n=1 Tax=Alicyclobacillus sp. SO9 TaxID=2665646 RepID=UPI0018E80438|nr:hypothetical protein [Alicyclobacillus sp. SO9]QQE81007.1 hypothetical protein GI364_11875 [Alicyclobacillus sp. SO9]